MPAVVYHCCRLLQACLDCTGVVIFTGVGKSGLIAQKICQTLVSTGTKAMFLSPQDALHGDIGILSSSDLLVCFSKSGATEEIIRLVPYARVRGGTVVPPIETHSRVATGTPSNRP